MHAVIAYLRTYSGGQRAPVRAHVVVVSTSVRACTRSGSHGGHVLECGAMTSIECEFNPMTRMWCNGIHARLWACIGSQRMLTRMQWHSKNAHTHAVAVDAGSHRVLAHV